MVYSAQTKYFIMHSMCTLYCYTLYRATINEIRLADLAQFLCIYCKNHIKNTKCRPFADFFLSFNVKNADLSYIFIFFPNLCFVFGHIVFDVTSVAAGLVAASVTTTAAVAASVILAAIVVATNLLAANAPVSAATS